LSAEFRDRIRFYHVNVRNESLLDLKLQYKVESLPKILVF
jgi:hypothetical protein